MEKFLVEYPDDIPKGYGFSVIYEDTQITYFKKWFGIKYKHIDIVCEDGFNKWEIKISKLPKEIKELIEFYEQAVKL